jgi:carbon starvation protein
MGFPVDKINELSQLVGINIAGRPGGAVSLAVGMAYIFSSIPFLSHLMAYLYQFAIMFEALFILTTIDAGTRVARYVVQELGGYIYKPFGDLRSLYGNIIASLIVVFAWGYFIYTGSVQTIWRMFGTANQLLAMLALCIGTTIIIRMNKIKYIWVTLIPMLFMLTTTFTAGIILIMEYIPLALSTQPDAYTYMINIVLLGLMILLALFILLDSMYKWYGFITGKRPLQNNTGEPSQYSKEFPKMSD